MAYVWLATPEEAAAVAGLLVEFRDWHERTDPPDEAFHRVVRELISDPATDYLLGSAEQGEAPAGVVQQRYRHGVWRDGDDAWLEDLFVRSQARGAGLGRALAEAAVQRARERGCVRIALDVDAGNAAARGLYASLGLASPGGPTLLMGMPLEVGGE